MKRSRRGDVAMLLVAIGLAEAALSKAGADPFWAANAAAGVALGLAIVRRLGRIAAALERREREERRERSRGHDAPQAAAGRNVAEDDGRRDEAPAHDGGKLERADFAIDGDGGGESQRADFAIERAARTAAPLACAAAPPQGPVVPPAAPPGNAAAPRDRVSGASPSADDGEPTITRLRDIFPYAYYDRSEPFD